MPTLDPRLRRQLRTANQKMFDRGIRHATFLEGLKTHQANQVVGFLNEKVFPDLLSQVNRRLENIAIRGFDTGPFTTKRLKDLHAAVDGIISTGIRNATNGFLTKDLKELAVTEAEWQRAVIQGSSPVEFSLRTPTVRLLNSVVTSRPMQGRFVRDWVKDIDRDTRRRIRQQIQIGIAEGESVPKIVTRLRGTSALGFKDGALEVTRRHATGIVRTSITHVSAHAREATYEDNQDVVKGVQWVSTLDGRTTVICQGLDGKSFPVGKGIRPPAHPLCRSTTVPIVKSWKEMGINLREAPRGTRASLDGQVPAKVTYGDWLKGQPKSIQVEALGVKRAELFRTGKVKIDRFTDARHQPLTLKEIRIREGLD